MAMIDWNEVRAGAVAAEQMQKDAQRYRWLRDKHAQALCGALYGQDVPCDLPADWGRELDEWVDADAAATPAVGAA